MCMLVISIIFCLPLDIFYLWFLHVRPRRAMYHLLTSGRQPRASISLHLRDDFVVRDELKLSSLSSSIGWSMIFRSMILISPVKFFIFHVIFLVFYLIHLFFSSGDSTFLRYQLIYLRWQVCDKLAPRFILSAKSVVQGSYSLTEFKDFSRTFQDHGHHFPARSAHS